MKFLIKGPFKENIQNLARQAGYSFQSKDKESSQLSFARPSRGYPRFHLYLKMKGDDLIANLHLDQKRPIYKGAPAHAGEYEGKIIEEEIGRIKKNWEKMVLL